MPGEEGPRETEEFARTLRDLKDRSGLSYGALATRLHMSTSTLHRYCHGTAVPNEYAPVERLARLCRATPEELVDLHRRWVVADVARRLRGDQAAVTRAAAVGAGDATAELAATDSATPDGGSGDGGEDGAGTGTGVASGTGAGDPDEPVVVSVARGPASPRRRRNALIASAAVAAALVATVVVTRSPWDGAGSRQTADSAPSTGTADAKVPSAAPPTSGPSRTPSASAPATKAGAGAVGASQDSSPTPGAKVRPTGSVAGASPTKPGTAVGPTGGSSAVPITVGVRPYVYDNPCSQHFLVDSAPAQVGPPANEQDAPRWAAAYGAVSSGDQRVALTIQGTGTETVVLEALHVSVVTKGAPLAWNDYSMATGCGGGVDTKSFDVDLDKSTPTTTVKNGQVDFPYKVSESDPEVFYVTAHTKAHDVRWNLTLDWSSGSRHGAVRIDNKGIAFRTSADVNRPGYDYPPGYSDWITRTN